jgi:hypothetical protein
VLLSPLTVKSCASWGSCPTYRSVAVVLAVVPALAAGLLPPLLDRANLDNDGLSEPPVQQTGWTRYRH